MIKLGLPKNYLSKFTIDSRNSLLAFPKFFLSILALNLVLITEFGLVMCTLSAQPTGVDGLLV